MKVVFWLFQYIFNNTQTTLKMCLITQTPELLSQYRRRIAYGEDPVQVSEYVEGLAKKRKLDPVTTK